MISTETEARFEKKILLVVFGRIPINILLSEPAELN